jgi:transcriptional regulator with XRE-family HTH domain
MTIKKSNADTDKFFDGLLGKKSLGKTLHAIRLSDEVSLTDFAKKLGISKQTLYDVESGRSLVAPQRASRFAKKLGYSEKVFITIALGDLLRKEGLKYTVVDLKAA